MGVVADVIFAVAVVTAAAGAVAEFQLRIGHIGTAADGALVSIGCFRLSDAGFVRAGAGEGDDLRLGGSRLRGSAEQPAGIEPPGNRNHIQHILAEEQEVIGQGNNGEEIAGESIHQQTVNHQRQIHQGKDQAFTGMMNSSRNWDWGYMVA